MTSGLEISMSGVIAGILFGVVGLWLFREGKKKTEFKFIFIGLALMIYPYFTTGPKADWGIGIALCALAYVIKDL